MKEEEKAKFNSSYAESIIIEWVTAKVKEPDLTKLDDEIRKCDSRESYLQLAALYSLNESEFNRQMVVRYKMVEGVNKYNRR